jgi:hypothetical protein
MPLLLRTKTPHHPIGVKLSKGKSSKKGCIQPFFCVICPIAIIMLSDKGGKYYDKRRKKNKTNKRQTISLGAYASR